MVIKSHTAKGTNRIPNNSESFRTVIKDFGAVPTKLAAQRLIKYFRQTTDPEPVAELAQVLANSGNRLDFEGKVGDIASTGGPSSLSTLLCPLYLALSGFIVAKLGVQGRPAGGIDVVAQIPGFDISPSPGKLRGIISQCCFAHFLADDTYAPLDQVLFRFRQELDAQSVKSLVVASILAKKLAVGVTTAGLEIRVFSGGNFGVDVPSASENARFFLKVAELLNIQGMCFLTDCTVPYQPFIGRGEAIRALHDLFYGAPSPWLVAHAAQCMRFARRMSGFATLSANVSETLKDARHVFERHLEAHGASLTGLHGVVSRLSSQTRHTVVSGEEGYVVYHLGALRDFIVRRQPTECSEHFPDRVGVELLKRPGEQVGRGEPVLKIRLPTDSKPPETVESLFSIGREPKHPFEDVVISKDIYGG